MMDMLGSWITGITCAAMILAAVQGLVQDGAVRKIANLAGGLLLMLALVSPVLKPDIEILPAEWTEHRGSETEAAGQLELENNRLILELTEEQTEAYITEKTKKMGLECAVSVRCGCDEDGNILPGSVTLRGSFSEYEVHELSRWLENDLAIGRENQTFEEGDAS